MASQPKKFQPRSSSSASTETILRTDPADQRACTTSTVEAGFCLDAAKNVPRDPTRNIPRMDPAVARKHFDRIGRFRILVIGRSNAGKTTLLQRICNTTELPEVFNSEGEKIDPKVVQGSLERGKHAIEDELIFRSNTGFIFHDSRGFEAGSEEEVKLMKKFLVHCAATMKLEKRIHAIWYCIPLTDFERPIVAAEELFFNECNTGNVPVIVVLTKADAMELHAIGKLRDNNLTIKEARSQAGELAKHMLTDITTKIKDQLAGCKYPPNDYVALFDMNKANAACDPLLRCTTNALNDIELQQLVISAQQVNFNLNIEFAMRYILKKVDGPFDKKDLESGILDWMPYLQSYKSTKLSLLALKESFEKESKEKLEKEKQLWWKSNSWEKSKELELKVDEWWSKKSEMGCFADEVDKLEDWWLSKLSSSVSDFMAGPAGCPLLSSLPLWSCCLDRRI